MPGTSFALEWSFLRAACSEGNQRDRIHSLLRSPIRWEVLFDLADRHGVLPLLYQALSKLQDAVPSDKMQALRQSFQTNLHKALFLSRELIRIVDRLSASGIEVIPYKGLALAETLYGDIAMRQAGDIDLLIRTKDFSDIRDAVRTLGYTRHALLTEAEEREYLKSGYECAFDGTAGQNLLEVQWAIQPRFYAVDLDMEHLFRRAGMLTVAGHSMKTLAAEDMFIVLALHAAKHVWGRLIWLCDLARIVKLPGLDWERIEIQAKELGVVRILRVTLLLANRMLGATADTGLLQDSSAEALADEIENYISSDSAFDTESLAYFRLMLQLRERRADRARFLKRLVFTPGPGEWKAIRLPRPLFPLYRLVRIARLSARVIRV